MYTHLYIFVGLRNFSDDFSSSISHAVSRSPLNVWDKRWTPLGPRGKFHVWCAKLPNSVLLFVDTFLCFPRFCNPTYQLIFEFAGNFSCASETTSQVEQLHQKLSTKLHCCWGLKGTSLRSMELARVSREISFSQREVQSTGFQQMTRPEVILSGVQWIQQVPILFEAVVLPDQPAGNPSKKMNQVWWGSKFWGS